MAEKDEGNMQGLQGLGGVQLGVAKTLVLRHCAETLVLKHMLEIKFVLFKKGCPLVLTQEDRAKEKK